MILLHQIPFFRQHVVFKEKEKNEEETQLWSLQSQTFGGRKEVKGGVGEERYMYIMR